jgi:hypothetical protein
MNPLNNKVKTKVQIKREDYMRVKGLQECAKREMTKEAWGMVYSFINGLAVEKYKLPERTGLYGLDVDGYFTHSLDAVERGKIERPNEEAYLNEPVHRNGAMPKPENFTPIH